MYPQYSVEAKTRQELRLLAHMFREKLGLKDAIWFPVVEILDALCVLLPDFSYEIVEDDELPMGVHADTDVINRSIRIRQSIYEGACDGEGRDRMTIAHEICHYLTIVEEGFNYRRIYGETPIRAFEDPEWQAKCMAGELLIDKRLTKNMSLTEIVEKCGVSFDAAVYQTKVFNKESDNVNV